MFQFNKEERIIKLFDFVSPSSIYTFPKNYNDNAVLIKMRKHEHTLFHVLFDAELLVKPYFEWDDEVSNSDFKLYLDYLSSNYELDEDKILFVNGKIISHYVLFQLEDMKQCQLNHLCNLLNELNCPEQKYGEWILISNHKLEFKCKDNIKLPDQNILYVLLEEAINKYCIDKSLNYELIVTPEDKENLKQLKETNPLEQKNELFQLPSSVLSILLKMLNNAIENKQIAIPYRISTSDYQASSNLLGKGQYAFVYKGEYQGKSVAIKMNIDNKNDTIRSLLNEQRMLERISEFRSQATPVEKEAANYLISYYGYDRGPSKINLVITYANLGSVIEYMRQGNKFNWQNVYPLIHHLMKSISFLHSHGIIHRDIKPENLLLHKKEDNQLELKLGDLGSARLTTAEEFSFYGATPAYFAPELINYEIVNIYDPKTEEAFSKQSDIFASGLTVWQMISGELSLHKHYRERGYHDCIDAMFYKARPKIPDALSIKGKLFLCSLWHKDPEKRFSAELAKNELNTSDDSTSAQLEEFYPYYEEIKKIK